MKKCRICGCTDLDCSGCIKKTGLPCGWEKGIKDICTVCYNEIGKFKCKYCSKFGCDNPNFHEVELIARYLEIKKMTIFKIHPIPTIKEFKKLKKELELIQETKNTYPIMHTGFEEMNGQKVKDKKSPLFGFRLLNWNKNKKKNKSKPKE